MKTFGAQRLDILQETYGKETMDQLINQKDLTILQSNMGELVCLGYQGRKKVGLRPNYLSPPDVAEEHVVRRQVREWLEQKNWQYLGITHRTTMMFKDVDNRNAYVLASKRGYTARSVRRILTERVNHILTGGYYLIFVPYPHYLRKMVAKHSALQVGKLEILTG